MPPISGFLDAHTRPSAAHTLGDRVGARLSVRNPFSTIYISSSIITYQFTLKHQPNVYSLFNSFHILFKVISTNQFFFFTFYIKCTKFEVGFLFCVYFFGHTKI